MNTHQYNMNSNEFTYFEKELLRYNKYVEMNRNSNEFT